jgi:CelD/BcsL family acetyltransferase involved in cellulose biosynthesis
MEKEMAAAGIASATIQASAPVTRAAVPRVVVVRTLHELAEHAPALEGLAGDALEPNVFYEPLLALPAVRSFGAAKQLEFVCVYLSDPREPGRAPRLVGFFPFERVRRYRGLPATGLVSFAHPHCFLGTPLVHREAGRAAFEAVFDWLTEHSGAALVEFRSISADGPVHQLIVHALHARRRPVWVRQWFSRAFFQPALDAETYLRGAISGGALKEVRRKERRLAEQGRLSWRELGPHEDARPWLDAFLGLEASGWKGQEQSALACRADEREFFLSAALAAHERGRLMLTGLFLDQRPLALKCNFLAADGAFAFKIAFDEAYAASSPGFMLEIDNVRRLHRRPAVRWMDSCAEPEHEMIDRLWPGRRTIATLVFATGRAPGELLVSLMPLLRWAWRKLAPRPRRGSGAREGSLDS